MNRYFIGIGSNNHSEYNCAAMIEALAASFQQVLISSVVKTSAQGINAPDYLNAVVCFESELNPVLLDEWCKKLELKLGRTRTRDGVCVADLDILDPENISEPFFQPLVQEVQGFLLGKEIRLDAVKIPLQIAGVSVGLGPCQWKQADYA